jgi:hypothetical protein
MANKNLGYQIGNYIKDWDQRLAIVKEITQRGICSLYENSEQKEVPWQDVYPVIITVDLLKQVGFSVIKDKTNPYHRDVAMTGVINGKFYNCRGILYEDKSLWSLHNISVRYFHQIQNILYIIEPSIELKIMPIVDVE